MSAVLSEIITLLTSGLADMAKGIGGGLKNLVESIFVDTTGTAPALTTFGGVIVIFAAIALAIGLIIAPFIKKENRLIYWKPLIALRTKV